MTIKPEKIDPYRWLIPKNGHMRVPGLVFSNEQMMRSIQKDQSLKQVVNVATLPGIVGHSLAMPDIHWGYGFPIGGVAAFDLDEGIVSPGGVGYDINCGCRLMTTRLRADEIRPIIKELVYALFKDIPTGVGSTGTLHLSKSKLKDVAVQGAAWAVKQGYGAAPDLEKTEALKKAKGRAIHRELEDIGVFVQSRGKRTLKEEMPQAYKNISQVVDVVHKAGLARKVARLRPMGVIKG